MPGHLKERTGVTFGERPSTNASRFRPWSRHRTIATLSVLLLGLAGCKEAEDVEKTPPRPIVHFTVTEASGTVIRRFSGVSEASEITALSFPLAGTIANIPVNVGDKIDTGDLIASLDPEPFELDVQAARAEVEKATSDLVAKKGDHERNKTLFTKGWVSKAAIEKYQAAFDAAKSTQEYARSRLALAEHNLANTVLRAPYQGTIGKRLVERFEDVATAQPVVELNSVAGFIVSFSVPETLINRVGLGQHVLVSFATFGGKEIRATVTEIETAASEGNAYRVEASLIAPPDEIRSGMTAQVRVTDPGGGPETGHFVPLSAIAPGDEENIGYVFKYDAKETIVRRTPIRVTGAHGEFVIVQNGVAPGDIIASAGVSFLRDGQSVRLLGE